MTKVSSCTGVMVLRFHQCFRIYFHCLVFPILTWCKRTQHTNHCPILLKMHARDACMNGTELMDSEPSMYRVLWSPSMPTLFSIIPHRFVSLVPITLRCC